MDHTMKRNDHGPSRLSTKAAATVVYGVFGAAEVFLLLRLVFKLSAADPRGAFVAFIYSVTDIFTAPFTRLFTSSVVTAAQLVPVLEPATVIVLLLFALAAWSAVKLLIITAPKRTP